MIDILNVFSQEEKIAMNNYVKFYASTNDSNFQNRIDFCDVLAGVWAEDKEPLYNLFGGKLILEKEIEYSTPENELIRSLQDEMANGDMQKFKANFNKQWFCIPFGTVKYRNYSTVLSWALDSHPLCKNKISHAIELIDERTEGKTYKFPIGSKALKVIKKLAEIYNIEGFEEFRLAHSRILNKKKFSGTLCLSIHPLDYMTMSDNDYDWSSCMSWQDNGCYRRGTVEMMNSPSAIVAYLKGEKDYYITNDFAWNNKKWRTLILLTPDIITHIKAYPYASDELTTAAVQWVAELANQETKEYDIDKMEYYQYCNGFVNKKNERVYNISMQTYAMYNDFGCAPDPGHLCIPAVRYLKAGCPLTKYYYSGREQCVWCGGIHQLFDHEEILICYDCGGRDHMSECPWCGEAVYEDDMWEIDGESICEYCYENHSVETAVPADEYHLDENCVLVYLIGRNDTRRWSAENIYVYAPDYDMVYAERALPHLYKREVDRLWAVDPREATDDELKYFGVERNELNEYLDDIK